MTRQHTATARTDSGLTSGPSRRRLAARPLPTAIDPREAAALDFLADVLLGDTIWSLGEVGSVLALHALVGLGHWSGRGLHGR